MRQKQCLKLAKCFRQRGERRPIAQRARLALQHGEIMPPVVESGTTVMAPVDVARMLRDDVTFGDDNEAICIDPQTHGQVGVGRGDAICLLYTSDAADE